MQQIISDVVREISATCEQESIFARGPRRQIPQRDQIIYIIDELRKAISAMRATTFFSVSPSPAYGTRCTSRSSSPFPTKTAIARP